MAHLMQSGNHGIHTQAGRETHPQAATKHCQVAHEPEGLTILRDMYRDRGLSAVSSACGMPSMLCMHQLSA